MSAPRLPDAPGSYDVGYMSRLLSSLRTYFVQLEAVRHINIASCNINLDTLPTTDTGARDGDVWVDGNVLKVAGLTGGGGSVAWGSITGTPTTIAGYGITDFNSLGDARWSLTGHTHTTLANDLSLPRLRLTATDDVSLASTLHALQIGPDGFSNVAIDANEIMARNNGAVSQLHLNAEGGGVTIGGNITTTQVAATDLYLYLQRDAGKWGVVSFRTGTSQRWLVGASSDGESGSNAGSNFNIRRYDDAGTYLDTSFQIARSTGVATFSQTPTVGGTAVSLAGHTHSYLPLAGGTLTGDLTISKTAANAILHLDANAGQMRLIRFRTGTSDRWRVLANTAAESGSNVGSDFRVERYDDAGTLVDAPINITRSSGRVTFSTTPYVSATAVSLDGHTHSYLPLSGGTLTGTLTGLIIEANVSGGGAGELRFYDRDGDNSYGSWYRNGSSSRLYDTTSSSDVLTIANGGDLLSSGSITAVGSVKAGNGGAGEKTLGLHNDSKYVYFYLQSSGGEVGLWDSTGSLKRFYSDASQNFVSLGNVTAYSDERLKSEFYDANVTLDQMLELKPEGFLRTDTGQWQVGVRAQALQKVLPEAIVTDTQGYLSVNYGAAAMVLILNLAREVAELKRQLNGKERNSN